MKSGPSSRASRNRARPLPPPPLAVGGVFGLPEACPWMPRRPRQTTYPWNSPSDRTRTVEWLANSRCALWRILDARRPRRLWLPSYLCDTLLESARMSGTEVRFFPMTGSLLPDGKRWLSEVEPSDAVLMIDYFGFLAPEVWWQVIRSTGCLSIEDASQALLTDGVGRFSDYVLYSPRKFIGVPDGGMLVSCTRTAALAPTALRAAPADGWLASFEATWLRREQDRGGVSGPWFERFRAGEAAQPCGPYAMSDLSRRVLERGWDLRAVTAARRRNYRRLCASLLPWALFPELPPGVAPIGFPVRLSNRDAVRTALIDERIFPPVHWPIRGAVPDKFVRSHRLANELMTLPCDQRYGLADMDRMAAVFRAAGPGKWVAKPPVAGEA